MVLIRLIIAQKKGFLFFMSLVVCFFSFFLFFSLFLTQNQHPTTTDSNSPTIAHLLLQAGVNINHPDPQGNTPVHLSSLFSLPSLLDVLLEGGGGEEGGNEEGDTALHLACLGQSMECLKVSFWFWF